MRLEWSAQALQKAAEIVDHISVDRPRAAREWLDGLERRLTALPRLPEQGRAVPEWHQSTVREVMYSRYRIIYQVHEDRIELLTIRHQREDVSDPG